MPRSRDVKQGKGEQDKNLAQNDQTTTSLCNSTLPNRFKALTTDMFMLLMPIMYLVFYVIMGSRENFQEDMLNGWLYIVIPNMLAVVVFWYFKQQTPGMKAYEVKVIDSKTGKKPNIIKLFIRYILTFLVIFTPILWFVPFFNKQRKTFQDYLSGTCMTVKLNNQNI